MEEHKIYENFTFFIEGKLSMPLRHLRRAYNKIYKGIREVAIEISTFKNNLKIFEFEIFFADFDNFLPF